MKALKALVLFMAVLIIAGLALVGYTLMTKGAAKLHTPDTAMSAPPSDSMPPPPPSLPLALGTFPTLTLGEPKGTTVASITVDGPQALVHLVGGGVPERIVVIDLAHGTERGRIVVSAP